MRIVIWILFGQMSPEVSSQSWDNDQQHPKSAGNNDFLNPPGNRVKTNWYELDKKKIEDALKQTHRIVELQKQAKNVIFIMGDGMGVSTLTAARVYLAQTRNLTGEDAQLSWDRMPYSAFSKTYSTTELTPDSAPTATAMMTGEKTINDAVSVNQESIRANCRSSKGKELKSILHYFIEEGKWGGVISTARITHASPASTYAHSPERDWESDADLTEEAKVNGCKDIAAQLIDDDLNKKIRVILGGGRKNFFPNDTPDEEYPTHNGKREDGRNLVDDWKKLRAQELVPKEKFKYVNRLSEFNAIDENNIEYLLGLFERSHMQYNLDRAQDTFGEPSLSEMVEKSIKILQRSDKGYFLFVESGRIDHAHHGNLGMKALGDTAEMSDAVQKALDLTDEEDTLIVISADHSHTFTMAGYPDINTNILGFDNGMIAGDDKPYAILGYANGPGNRLHRSQNDVDVPRMNLTMIKNNMTQDKDFVFDSGIYKTSETHAGEDVAIFARGPMAHLFRGVQEQSYIGNLMMYASCVGKNKDLCENGPQQICPNHVTGGASLSVSSIILMTVCLLL